MTIQVVLSIAVLNVFVILSANGYYMSRDMSKHYIIKYCIYSYSSFLVWKIALYSSKLTNKQTKLA